MIDEARDQTHRRANGEYSRNVVRTTKLIEPPTPDGQHGDSGQIEQPYEYDRAVHSDRGGGESVRQ